MSTKTIPSQWAVLTGDFDTLLPPSQINDKSATDVLCLYPYSYLPADEIDEIEPWHDPVSYDEWLRERLRYAVVNLKDSVQVSPGICHGIPVLAGTRFTVSQLLAELAEGRSIKNISRAYELDVNEIRSLLHGLSICLDVPYYR